MISFSAEKFEVELIELSAASGALGGYIRVVDETNDRCGFRSIKIPAGVVGRFVKLHKTSKYIKPVWTALLRYDGEVVAMERHPMGAMGTLYHEDLMGEETRWIPQLERAIPQLDVATKIGDWFTDGQFVYSFEGELDTIIAKAPRLSADGRFRSVEVSAMDLSKMLDPDTGNISLDAIGRVCVAFVAKNGTYGISPPVWSSLDGVGERQLSDSTMIPSVADPRQFDKVDCALGVNINFAVAAGKQLSEIFGYRAIEPLKLPQIMLALRTVNVPALPTSIKETFDIGLKFSDTVAWLIGFCYRSPDLATYRVVRRVMRHLTTRGIFRKRMFEDQHVFKKGESLDSIPLKSIKNAKLARDVDMNEVLALLAETSGTEITRGGKVAREELVMSSLIGEMD